MSLSINGVGMTSQRTRDRLINLLKQQNIKNEKVLEVIASIPRHLFVDEALASRAYDNISLPIGHGQTISQPYMVARMTELLLEGGCVNKVLEVGTGSGYQTSVLSRLVPTVYSVERIKPLLSISSAFLPSSKSCLTLATASSFSPSITNSFNFSIFSFTYLMLIGYFPYFFVASIIALKFSGFT